MSPSKLHSSTPHSQPVRRQLRHGLPYPYASLLSIVVAAGLWAGAIAPVHAQDTCADSSCAPTMADVTAIKMQTLMATAKAELAKERAKASNPDASARGGAVGGSTVGVETSDPTVVMVMGSPKGLVATLAFPSGGIQKKHAGDTLGRGMKIESVSVTDVVVRDGHGRRSLNWSDGANTGGTTMPSSVPMAPAPAFMPAPAPLAPAG